MNSFLDHDFAISQIFSPIVMTYFERFCVGQDEVILVMLGSQPTASAVEGYAKESLKLPPVTGTRSEDVGMFRCFFISHVAHWRSCFHSPSQLPDIDAAFFGCCMLFEFSDYQVCAIGMWQAESESLRTALHQHGTFGTKQQGQLGLVYIRDLR